jgi:pimeloyl-ACP methyl ester carboxylesterase
MEAEAAPEPIPAWFQNIISTLQFEHHSISVTSDIDGTSTPIHYQLFRPPTDVPKRCGVVLVHGGGAHSRWWDWTAPYLQQDGHTVACLDLSGQGDSGVRQVYSMTTNVIEVMAVARQLAQKHEAPADTKPVVIGHSFGGWVTLMCGSSHGHELGGTIVLDSSVRPAWHPDNLRRPPMGKKKPGTSTASELKQRFRLMPPQPTTNQFLLDYIFPLSITKRNGKVEWKDDPMRFAKMQNFYTTLTEDDMKNVTRMMSERLRGQQCRLTLLYGEKSQFFSDPAILKYMRQELDEYPPEGQQYTPIIMIPNAHHHVMFDAPLVVITALRTILGGWHDSSCLPVLLSKL